MRRLRLKKAGLTNPTSTAMWNSRFTHLMYVVIRGGNDVTFMFELSVGWVGRGKGLAYAHSGVIVEQDVSLR